MHVIGDDMDDESPGHTGGAGYELEVPDEPFAGERMCRGCCESDTPERQGQAGGPGDQSLDHVSTRCRRS